MRCLNTLFCSVLQVCAFGAAAFAQERSAVTTSEPVRTVIRSLLLDGRESSFSNTRVIEVPHGVRDVHIRFEAVPAQKDATRLRYRLVGHDEGWRELPGLVRASVTVFDLQGAVLSAAHAQMQGASKGWAGALERSHFSDRMLEMTLPESAHQAQVEFVSGGAETTLGLYAFTEVQAQITSSDGAHRSFSISVAGGEGRSAFAETPSPWRRSGSMPQMAGTKSLEGEAGRPVMLLGDTALPRTPRGVSTRAT